MRICVNRLPARVTAIGTEPQRVGVNADLTPLTGGPVDMPVGNPVALCDTQHARKEILTRPMSEYLPNDPDCVVLSCGMQGSNHIMLVPDNNVHLCTLYTWTNGHTRHIFVYTSCPQKNKPREFFALFYLGLMKLVVVCNCNYLTGHCRLSAKVTFAIFFSYIKFSENLT